MDFDRCHWVQIYQHLATKPEVDFQAPVEYHIFRNEQSGLVPPNSVGEKLANRGFYN